MALGTQPGGTYYGISGTDNLLKTDFLNVIRDQFPENIVALKLLRRSAENVDTEGDSAKWELRLGRSASTGYLPPGGQMPNSGFQNTQKATTILKTGYARIEIDDKLIKMSRNKQGTYRNKLTDEMQRIILDAKNRFNIALHGDGTVNIGTVVS